MSSHTEVPRIERIRSRLDELVVLRTIYGLSLSEHTEYDSLIDHEARYLATVTR